MLTYKVKSGEYTFTFKCTCSSKEFVRPKWAMKLTCFYEGSFNCAKCNKEHDYTSPAFTRNITQLKLSF
jgi:hypothetical protein